jgi:FkbM family methyltransferase
MSLRKTARKWVYRYVPGLAGRFPYFGTRVYFSTNSSLWDTVCREGIYESALLCQVLGATRPNTWFFDVGANIGLMSVPVLNQIPNVQVLSFEPSPNTKPFLQKTWSQSPWKDRWKIVECAVGDKVGETSFCVSVPEYADYDGIRHTNRVEKAGVVVVPVTTLDEEWKALGSPQVSCIKLDIEGAEAMALAGARELIRAHRPHIFLEWFQKNFEAFGSQAQDLLEYAGEFGYDTVAIPNLNVISSLPVLLLHMHTTATFALVPKGAERGASALR